MSKIVYSKYILCAFATILCQSVNAQLRSDHDTRLEEIWADRLTNVRPLFKSDTISVSIIGDVMMHRVQIGKDHRHFLDGIAGKLHESDFAIANMEFTLAGKPYTGYPSFSAPDGYEESVHEDGINVFLTANNHINDKRQAGMARTLGIYRKMQDDGDIRFTGIASDGKELEENYPLMLRMGDLRVAILNFTYGTNIPCDYEWPKVNRADRNDIMDAIERAKTREADFIVAIPHWGYEYVLRHSSSQASLAEWLISNGVDAIVGAHPHVVQDSTHINGAPVFYSIGNAVSNMSARNTRLELMVTLRFVKDFLGETTMLKPEIDFMWCTLPGKLSDNFGVILVKDYIGRRHLWKDPSDYDNMVSTYVRVKKETGIVDD